MNALMLAAAISQFAIPDREIGREVLREWPEISEASDFERVNMLRCWAWAHTDFVHCKSSGKEGVDSPFHIGYPTCPSKMDYTPGIFYGHFAKNKGGVWVTECQAGFQSLLIEFGYKTAGVTTGGPNFEDSHHPQTLVEIEHRGKKILTLHDATFNLTFVDRVTMEPLDYFEIVRRLGRRAHTSIRAVGQDYMQVPRWPSVYFPDDKLNGRTPDEAQRDVWPILDDVFVAQNVNGNLIYTSPRTLEKWLRVEGHDSVTGRPKFLQRLVDLGYPPDWLYIHMKLHAIGSRRFKKNELARRYVAALSLGEGERIELGR